MRRAEIDRQNAYMLKRQRDFRAAADAVCDAWSDFGEVHAVAVVGSVARALWMEVPRFSAYRRKGIKVWHECSDLDLVLWLDGQHRLNALRQAAATALRTASERDVTFSVPSHQLDVFLMQPGSDRYLGRLCKFNACPKRKLECAAPGCGATPFNRSFTGFRLDVNFLADVENAMLYRRGEGRLRSALDLPLPAPPS